VYLIY